MELNLIYNNTEKEMEQSIDAMKTRLSKIRTGKANLSLLDDIKVDYYGQETPIQHVGSLSTPEARIIMIKPWEASMLEKIEKSILASNIGITPQNDGKVIRLIFPSLTEDRRKELVKKINSIGEEAKIAVRNTRRNSNDEVKKMEKNSDISEDNAKIALEEIQDITNDSTDKIGTIVTNKEKEIMEI